MNIATAKEFVKTHARPIDLAVYRYFFEHGSNKDVVKELEQYQNEDSGFGHGLEADYLNPNSSPIAVNDAIITLYKVGALKKDLKMCHDIVRYLNSHDSFDEEKRRWLFAIDSNKDYPHAIWWEKNETDGIHGFNPTMSLAAFMLCYGDRPDYYESILLEGIEYLKQTVDWGADALKCYLLAYSLLKDNSIDCAIHMEDFKALLSMKIFDAICKDTDKYGVEYVAMPSDLFAGCYTDFITPEIQPLIDSEKEILNKLQKEDGGFDISWQWYTPYPEFEDARKHWRPRLTIEKLLFALIPSI